MILFIDNTEDEQVVFYYFLDNKFAQTTVKVKNNQDLLVSLDIFLSELKISVSAITVLGVVVGAGKFTGTRLAVTMANTLAYSLKIPIISLEKNFDTQLALEMAKAAPVGTYIMPVYSGPARTS
ncbi:MAG: hypothetical protein KBC69_00970 [Candidatus Magasanikbacteria bacterium]|nr:hypothetical protein [Candidatus Magasanikbacteria bacterium]